MNKKGFVLWLVSGFVLVLVMMVIGFIVLVNNEIIKADQQGDSLRAFFLAEGGIEKGIYELSKDNTYAGETDISFGQGIYDVTVTSLAGTQKQIDAAGYVANKTSPRAQRSIRVIVEKPDSPITLGGALTSGGPVELKADSTIDGGGDSAGVVTTDDDTVTQANPSNLLGTPPISEVAEPVTFEDVFGMTPAEMKALATVTIDPALNQPADPTGVNWVDGDAKYTNDWTGSGIFIVNGDLYFTAQGQFTGVIYVMGNADIGAQVVIDGGLVAQGSSMHRAQSFVNYDEAVNDGLGDLYPYEILTWEEMT